jgi:hypothetical protein
MYIKFLFTLLILSLFASCAVTSNSALNPTVNTAGNITNSFGSHFYVMGNTHYGINNTIIEYIREKGLHAQVLNNKRDIPRDLNGRIYIITHEYDLVSEDNDWRLDIRIYLFNPRGMDTQVALGTTTSSSSTRSIVYAVLSRIISS